MISKEEISDWFCSLQDSICKDLENLDGKSSFREDLWEREGGGGGRSRIIQDGAVIEKGGVNYSAVHGRLPEKIRTALSIEDEPFYATGVSIVIHPENPMVPIIHMNVRYFEVGEKWWFGGGIDLTPHYIDDADAEKFHGGLKELCDLFDPEFYEEFKQWADEYFVIKHRKETRGVGGIFFDRLNDNTKNLSKKQLFDFVKAIGEYFVPFYVDVANKNKDIEYGEQEKQWQLIRRGRYVEFNLVYDKGTRFGLDTDGRIESILMSLPKNASWLYDFTPVPGSKEELTLQKLKIA